MERIIWLPILSLAALASCLPGTTTMDVGAASTTSAIDTATITNGPKFPPVPSGTPSVTGMLIGSVSLINVANGSTTYQYVCPTSTSSSSGNDTFSTMDLGDDWVACDIFQADASDDDYDVSISNMTSVIGPSNLAYYQTSIWWDDTIYDTYGSPRSTDSSSHSAPITKSWNCPIKDGVISTCLYTWTASPINSAEVSQLSVYNSKFMSIQSSRLSEYPELGASVTLGAVPVVGGAAKLTAAPIPTVGSGKKNGAVSEKIIGTTFGLVVVALVIVIFT